MHPTEGPIAYFLELLMPLGPVVARRMFGGVGLFVRGTMFGLVARDELYFKVSDLNRADYEAAGEAPFHYETRHGTNTLKSYWRFPPDLLDDTATFQAWAQKAMAAAADAVRDGTKSPRRRVSQRMP